MRYAQFDYHPRTTEATGDQMSRWWSSHWEGRQGLRSDLRDEPLWPTIEDVLQKPALILEAGCGTGQWVQFLGSLGHTTIGVDYAPAGLRVGKTFNATLRLVAGDLRTLPFPDDVFDYICSFGAVEHDVRGPEYALRELRRVLKPSGRLLCSVPCLNIERTPFVGWFVLRDWLKQREVLRRLAGKTAAFRFYEYVYSPSTYKKILSDCGFDVLALRPYGRMGNSRVGSALARVVGRRFRFYDAHMVLAVCARRPGS